MASNSQTGGISMKEETDQDLLVITSMKDDLEISNQAFTEFYGRYKDFLWNAITMICDVNANHYELSRAVHSNTTINAYHYAGSFSVDEKLSQEEIKLKIEGWLVAIARREYKSLVSANEKPIDPEDTTFMLIDDSTAEGIFKEGNDEEISISESAVGKALEQLPRERDRHILRTYYQYYEMGEGSQAKNLSPQIRKELADRYNTTEENIRQIISRSKKIVIEFLKTNYDFETPDV